MVTVEKNDFIELEFTGKSDNEVFDTTSKEEAKKINLDLEVKPLIISVGNDMLLKGFDEDLPGKELGKKYTIHLTPEKAFGKRNPSLIRLIPMRVFVQNKINPYRGLTLQLDNSLAKVISVSGGRVTVDFNNPLAGKEVDYEYTIKRKVDDINEKINAIQDYFFKMRFEYKIVDKKIVFNNKNIKPLIDLFKDKFKSMLGYDFVIEEKVEEKKIEEKKENKKPEEKKQDNKAPLNKDYKEQKKPDVKK